jgi:excisionase family DNA binding protein
VIGRALNLTQAAKLVGVSRNTLYAAIRDGRLRCTLAGRPGKSTFVTLEALQQAGFTLPEEAARLERSSERSERPQRPERPEHAEPASDLAALNITLDRLERTVERLERSLDMAIDRMDERAEHSIERALERVIERLLERRAREAVPAIPVRPWAKVPTEPSIKAAVLSRLRTMQAAGLSLQKIADQLNAAGVPTLSGKGRWQKGTIGHLLAQAGEG